MKSLKLLIYADVNLNVIDGSSIWLADFLSLLSKDHRIRSDFLMKAAGNGGPLCEQIKNLSNVTLIEKENKPLANEKAAAYIRDLDNKKRYDRIFIRGNIALCNTLANELSDRLVPYMLEPAQRIDGLNESEKEAICNISKNSAFVVVQSDYMRKLYNQAFSIDWQHMTVFPPMIPHSKESPSFRNISNTLCYTGKFSYDWGTLDLIETYKNLQKKLPYVKLSIAGNKFNNDLLDYKEEIESFFENNEKINWVGGVSRAESIALAQSSDVGFALRSECIDNNNSHEISTKLFEYLSAGKPVILRPTQIHKKLLGSDYPLFAESPKEAAEKCTSILTNVPLYDKTSRQCYTTYLEYNNKYDHKELIEKLFDKQKTTILFSGHDLKFTTDIMTYFKYNPGYDVLIDQWKNHSKHNVKASWEMLVQADIIFCEWGLGNIEWYSKNKLQGQKLIVRIHRQENQRKQHLAKSDHNNINYYIFITPYRYEEFIKIFNLSRIKSRMIFNSVDTKAFDKQKTEDARFNLGFVGIVPFMKRFDKALYIFEMLWNENSRYKLFVKGKLPEEYPWMHQQSRNAELEDYKKLYKRIADAPWSKNVVFDGHGDDMPEWFQKIGYILSTSDFEGSHQAVAEGMASGAVPVILDWAGAETIYPGKYIFTTINSMTHFIQNNTIYKFCDEIKKFARENFDKEKITQKIEHVLHESLCQL